MFYKLKQIILYLILIPMTFMANLSIKCFSFKKLMSILTNTDGEIKWELKANQAYDKKIGRLFEVNRMLLNMEKTMPYRVKCFEQAIIILCFARLLKVDVSVYFGLCREEGKLVAHAWTKSGQKVISGRQGYEWYTVVLKKTYKAS